MLIMNDLKKRQGETDFEFHKRVIYGKLVDKTLSDYDYTEIASAIYGRPYAPDVSRRMAYGSKRTLDLIEAENITASTPDDIVGKITDLRIERQKLFDERAALNKSIRAVARQQELSDIIQRAVADGSLPVIDKAERAASEDDWSDCDILVSLNDIHYGAVVDNHWCKYNSDIAIEMASNYIDSVIKIAKTHKARNCYIYNAGDSISGSIHRSIQVTNKENVIQQVCGVSELIANFICELAPYFEGVYYINVAGNHSRIEADKKHALIPERLDNLIGWYLDARVKHIDSVHILNDALIDDTMASFDIRGKRYVVVHGDFDNTTASIQNLKAMCDDGGDGDLYAVLSGHLHHNKIDSVCGCKSVMAGSFLGMDEYCVSKRIVGKPEQLVCVCDDGGIRCSYDIDLSYPVRHS